MKVLILENFYYRAGEFCKRFAAIGITDVRHAATVPEFIKMLSGDAYDIICLDYHLESMEFQALSETNNGATAARWIRDNPSTVGEDTLIIVHSGSDTGAQEIISILPQAHYIRQAWKKEVFEDVKKIITKS